MFTCNFETFVHSVCNDTLDMLNFNFFVKLVCVKGFENLTDTSCQVCPDDTYKLEIGTFLSYFSCQI